MLQALMIQGNGILEQLRILGCKKSFPDENEADVFVNELQALTAKAREAWAFAVCSDVGEAVLIRYFSYQLRYLYALLPELTGAISCSSFGPDTMPEMRYERSVCELIDHAGDYFLRYLNASPPVCAAYKKHFLHHLQADAGLILSALKSSPLAEGIKNALTGYLEDMTGYDRSPCTPAQLHYFRLFVFELLPVVKVKEHRDLNDFVKDCLFKLEFNQFGVFVCLQDVIRLSYTGKPLGKRKLIISRQLELLTFKARGDVPRYDDRYPSLSAMLAEWLKNEEMVMEKGPAQQIFAPASLFKLPLRLPVTHLAFLVRLLYKANVFGSVQLKEIFTFFTTHVSTKRQQHLSAGAFSKDYYTKDMVTAAEVRHLLSKMISEINRDYFPALAVICTAFFYR